MLTFDPYKYDVQTLTDDDRLEVLARCAVDTAYACKFLYPEDFYASFTKLHFKVFDALDHCEAKKIVIDGARGFGKSTICEAKVKNSVILGTNRFIGYLSNSSSSAELYTENIKLDLLSNERIHALGFKSITAGQEGLSEELMKRFSFSKKSWVANGRTLVLPRGAGQQVRGLKWIRYRPDLWIIDDLENDEEVENERQREKLMNWFFGALLKTVNRYTGNYKIIYIDTVKHEDALITHLKDDPDWENISIPAYTTDDKGKYVTVDEGFLTQEELDKEVEAHRRRGQMDLLARELGCQATSREDNEFLGNFRYYHEDDLGFVSRLRYLETFVICDPAKTKKLSSAESGFLVVSVDVERRSIYFRLAIGKRVTPNELYSTLFNLCKQYGATSFGVEVTGLEEHITYPIRNYMVMNNLTYLNFIELEARSGKGEFSGDNAKVGRARGIIPLYQQGLIYHNYNACAELEAQELSFPRPKRWDVLDCAGYVPQMLELGLRYMNSSSSLDEETAEMIEEEFADLDNEPILNMSWRSV